MRKLFLLSLLLCAACARNAPPAPVSQFGVHTRESFAALVRDVTPGPAVIAVPVTPVVAQQIVPRPVVVAQKPRTVRSVLVAGKPALSLKPIQPMPILVQAVPSRKGFIWPVRGRVISGYGPKEGGLYNDGINIAAPRNTPVAAAADGVVAYVGRGIESYGNLVLVRHGGGMVTAYAHLADVKVKQGMPVKKGQSIGAVGNTGAVASSQLHFEIRQKGDAVDPKKFLG